MVTCRNLPPQLTVTLFGCLRNVTQLHFLYGFVKSWDLVKIITVYSGRIFFGHALVKVTCHELQHNSNGCKRWKDREWSWSCPDRKLIRLAGVRSLALCCCIFLRCFIQKVNCVLNVIVFNRMIKMVFLFIYVIDCFLYTSDIQEFLLFYLRNVRKCLTLRSMTALWSHGKLARVPIILSRFMSSKKQKYFFWLFYLWEGYPRYGNYFYHEASE